MTFPVQFRVNWHGFKIPKRRVTYMKKPYTDEQTGGHKPRRVVFTSTYLPDAEYPSDWVKWCASEMPGWVIGKSMLLYYPSKTARVYVIDGIEDVATLMTRYPGTLTAKYEKYGLTRRTFADINWAEVSKEYDSVHVTERGEGETRTPNEIEYSLYGWDCESTAWFRHVFDKVEPYTKPVVVKKRDYEA